jgi:hypothetical protein
LANIKPTLSFTLKEQSQAANIDVHALYSGTNCVYCVLRGGIMQHSRLGEAVWLLWVHGYAEVILREAESDREAGD